MKTISFLNIKGGVGKSSSAVIISHILATKYKKKVLVVDTDPQGNTSAAFSDLQILERLECLLAKREFPLHRATLENLLLDKDVSAKDAIHQTAYPGLHLIPSLITLSEAEERLKADVTTPQQFRLKNKLKQVEDEYDYCIIDCNPSINIININALVTSDKVYIPMKCDAWSGMGMMVARNLIETVQSFHPSLKIGGCFFVQFEPNKVVTQQAYEILQEYMGKELLPYTIRKSKLIEEMSFTQIPLLEADPNTKGNYLPVTKDYLDLTKYIMTNV